MGRRVGRGTHGARRSRQPRTTLCRVRRAHLDEDRLFGGDGHVCARWTLRGVHTGEYGGFAPTYREIAIDTCEVYTFTGDTVTECHVYGESMSLFNQLSGSADD